MLPHKEFKISDYYTAIETLRQKIDAKFINTYKNIRSDLIKIEEHTYWKDIIFFISQLLVDINQVNDILLKYINTEDKQFQKLVCIIASNISNVVEYFQKIEEILNDHIYTSDQLRKIVKLKDLNTFNIILAQMNEYIEKKRLESDFIFEFLKITIMSNSPLVRGTALKTLMNIYPVKSIPLLRIWVEKEHSIFVARKIWKHLEESNYEDHHQLSTILLDKISKYNYNLDPNEVKFLLDWEDELFEFQFPCIQLQLNMEYDDLLKKYPPYINFEKGYSGILFDWKSYPTTIHYTYIKLSQLNPGGEETSIYNGHISGLILRDVNKIPDTIGYLSKLKFLSIEWCENLTELPESFKNLINLRYLYFHETGLTELPEFIASLPKLRYLGLNGISLGKIPQLAKIKARKYHSRKYIKESMKKEDAYVLGILEILVGRHIDNVRKKVIEDMISLALMPSFADLKSKISNEKYIKSEMERYFTDAHGTNFYKINEEGYVTGISLTSYEGSVSIKHIPEEIGNLKHIEELVISTGDQFTLPETITRLTSLKTLSLYRNMIKLLPESIGNLKSLEYLDLSNNDISVIPDSIGELSSLRNLSLYGNNIAIIPESISKLHSLRSLNLNSNKLVSVPETIGDLKNLELLDLSNNELESIPKSIVNLKKLRVISLHGNPLKILPELLSLIKSSHYRNNKEILARIPKEYKKEFKKRLRKK